MIFSIQDFYKSKGYHKYQITVLFEIWFFLISLVQHTIEAVSVNAFIRKFDKSETNANFLLSYLHKNETETFISNLIWWLFDEYVTFGV